MLQDGMKNNHNNNVSWSFTHCPTSLGSSYCLMPWLLLVPRGIHCPISLNCPTFKCSSIIPFHQIVQLPEVIHCATLMIHKLSNSSRFIHTPTSLNLSIVSMPCIHSLFNLLKYSKDIHCLTSSNSIHFQKLKAFDTSWHPRKVLFVIFKSWFLPVKGLILNQ